MDLTLGRMIINEKFISDTSLKDKQLKTVSISYDYIDDVSIPTLIVGWNNVVNIFGDEASILNKRISNTIFWTFSPDEKLQHFNEDIKKYVDMLHDDLFKGYSYNFIEPIGFKISTYEDILKYMEVDICDSIYITENFIYIYIKSTRSIYGIDLEYYSLINLDIETIKSNLSLNSKQVLIEDHTENGYYNQYKTLFQSDFDKKYIPLLEVIKKK